MSTQRKTYRFRMEPTTTQRNALNRMAGCRRFVWNWALRRWNDYYAEHGKSIPQSVLSAELTALKKQPGMEWLAEADAQALQQVLRDLHRTFVNFFEKRTKYPRFKSKKRDMPRFRTPQAAKIADGKVYVPKIGWIRIRQSQAIDGGTKSATFKRDTRGRWFVTLVVEFEMPDVALPTTDPDKVIGIDLGLINFVTPSDGSDSIPSPKFYRKGEKKQRKAQRVFSRRKNGSKRKAKAARKVAIVRQKVAEQRKDFLHKLTTDLVGRYDGICIEDLCVTGLARTKLSKSVLDASWGEFKRQLAYKAEWNYKHLVIIDRFFPSSKMCHDCGALNGELTLKDREWDCICGTHHDRDLNAARNIRDEGFRILAAGQADKSNAQGASVRPATCGQLALN
jgi:putative transposase